MQNRKGKLPEYSISWVSRRIINKVKQDDEDQWDIMLMEKMKYENLNEGRTVVVQENRQVEIYELQKTPYLSMLDQEEKQPEQLKREKD